MDAAGAGLPNNFDSHGQQSLINLLPHDILAQVFEKLSVRFLLRCKSVCKLWLDFIESPDFVRLQIDSSNRRSSEEASGAGEKIFLQALFLPTRKNFNNRTRCYSSDTSSVQYLHQTLRSFAECCSTSRGFSVCSSGDGMLLVHQITRGSMFLWNPCTNKIRAIPPASGARQAQGYIIASGFGYDSSIQDYKIVTIQNHYFSSTMAEALVFTLKSRRKAATTWRTVQEFPDSYVIQYGQKTVSSQGSVHFLARHDDPDQRNFVILRVDLATERFREEILPAPIANLTRVDLCALKILDGRLSLQFNVILDGEDEGKSHRFEVWSMMEYGNSDSWSKILSIPCNRFTVPIAVMQNGDLLVRDKAELFLLDETNFKRKLQLPEETNAAFVVQFQNIDTYCESVATP